MASPASSTTRVKTTAPAPAPAPALAPAAATTTTTTTSTTTPPDDLQRLGRQRPALFASAAAEAGFVLSIVGSLMLSEYFIAGFNIVLPPLADALDMAGAATRTWPAAAFTLATAALLQPCARLCRLFGARRVFLAGHAWLLPWSVAAGFSRGPAVLVACRGMQGVGAAAFLPAGLALLSQTYRPGPRKNVVFAVYGAFACVGFYLGVLVGAAAAELLDWRWYFWMGAGLGVGVAGLGAATVPRRLGDVDAGARMDWWGVATVVPGVALVVFALTAGGHAPAGWRTPYVCVALALGVVFLAAAVYVQGWVSAQPLLPPELFRPRYMKRLMGALFCSYGVFGVFLFYASFYIETVMHASPLLAAAWFTPLAVGGIFLALGGGLILHLVPNRVLMIVSCLGFLLSTLLFALIPDGDGRSTASLYWAYVFPAMLGCTIGVDITFNVTNVFVTTAMPRRHQAAASGLLLSLLYLGMAFWLGVADMAVAAVAAGHGGSGGGGDDGLPPRAQYQVGFWTGVALSAASLCLTVGVRMGQAEAAMTADEKAELEAELEEEA